MHFVEMFREWLRKRERGAVPVDPREDVTEEIPVESMAEVIERGAVRS